MLGWLCKIIIGSFSSCAHEWETINEAPIEDVKAKVITGRLYVLKCKKCGDIQQRSISV